MPEPQLPPGMPLGWPPQAEDTRSGAEDDEDGNMSNGECDGGAGGGTGGAPSGEGNDRGDDEGGGEKGGGEDNGGDSGRDGGESDEAVQATIGDTRGVSQATPASGVREVSKRAKLSDGGEGTCSFSEEAQPIPLYRNRTGGPLHTEPVTMRHHRRIICRKAIRTRVVGHPKSTAGTWAT